MIFSVSMYLLIVVRRGSGMATAGIVLASLAIAQMIVYTIVSLVS